MSLFVLQLGQDSDVWTWIFLLSFLSSLFFFFLFLWQRSQKVFSLFWRISIMPEQSGVEHKFCFCFLYYWKEENKEREREEKINNRKRARYYFVYRKFLQRKPKSVSFAMLFYYRAFYYFFFYIKNERCWV